MNLYAYYQLSAALLFLASRVASAQTLLPITAGQTAGMQVHTLQPARQVSVITPSTSPYSLKQTDSLDLDADGRYDIRLKAEASEVPSTMTNPYAQRNLAVYLEAIGPDAQLAVEGPLATYPFAAGDSIKAVYAPPYNCCYQVWGTGFWPMNLSALSGGRITNRITWIPNTTYYAGVRLRVGSQWRYGWVRARVPAFNTAPPSGPSGTVEASLEVEAYAVYALGLGTATSRGGVAPASAGWLAFPMPVADVVRLNIPLALRGGTLHVIDLLGRPGLPDLPVPAGITPLLLNVAALPTGS